MWAGFSFITAVGFWREAVWIVVVLFFNGYVTTGVYKEEIVDSDGCV